MYYICNTIIIHKYFFCNISRIRMPDSEVITIRVPKGTKSAMRKMHINWSEEIREHIEDRVRAAKLLDILKTLKANSKKVKISGDSAEIIRRYRDAR